MPKSDQVEKKIMLVDGNELEGLVAIDEYTIEYGVVDIPSRNKTVPVADGVMKIPQITARYKIARNSKTLQFLEDWYYLKETHDVTIIRTDGAGREFKRELLPNTELSKCNSAGYDAASPTYAQAMIIMLPEDIIPIKAE